MTDSQARLMTDRFDALERRVRRTSLQLYAILGVSLVAACATMGPGSAVPDATDVLHVRGIVIEDGQGRPRLLLGAALAELGVTSLPDGVAALALLSEDGVPRVVVGEQTDPRIQGKRMERIAKAVGIQIMDPAGNERGGFSFLDDGRVVLGIDSPSREAATLFYLPDGSTGLTLSDPRGSGHERAGLVLGGDGTAVFKLADAANLERLAALVPPEGPLRLLTRDEEDNLVPLDLDRLQ